MTAATIDQPDTGRFFFPHGDRPAIDFCLPLMGENGFSRRDVQAAMNIVRYVDLVPGAISSPDQFILPQQSGRSCIVFGARYNEALPLVLKEGHFDEMIQFRFGSNWAIVCPNGKTFSISNPSVMGRPEYSGSTDYGVVGRVTGPERGCLFLVAGLGWRATEGCALFLAENWASLQRQYGDEDFTVILRFPPPVIPEKHYIATQYSRTTRYLPS